MKRTLLITVLTLTALLATGVASAAGLRLKAEHVCEGPELLLGDILVAGSAGELDARRIGASPAPGESRSITRRRLTRLLADWGWRGRVEGPETIVLTTPGVVLDTARLREAVERRLGLELEALGLRLKEIEGGWRDELLLSTTRIRWDLDLPNRIEQRSNAARLELSDASGFRRRLQLRFRCERPMQVAVAEGGIPRGATISGWRFEERDGFNIAGTPLTPAELPGAVATQPLKPGQVFTRGNTRPAPMVRAGREVEVRLQRGAVTVTLRGIARGDAALGEMVSVRHMDSRELRRYRVAGPGIVVPSYTQAAGGNS